MKPTPCTYTIGRGQWEQEIRYFTTEMVPDYWADFRPLGASDIKDIEQQTGRLLPEDFKEFLRVFGAGSFPHKFFGAIFPPEHLIPSCHGHLAMITGSLSPGAEWASEQNQMRFYVTRGAYNPAPDKYTDVALRLEDINLLDLLQIGLNGLCGYHQVYVGPKPTPLGYCLLTPESTLEDRRASFSDGLQAILTHHWRWDDPPEDEEGGAPGLLFEEA